MEVIKVENLYKQYRLGQVSTGSIAHDLNRWWHTARGKEDPYEKITGVNNREDSGSNDYVWALQDINFSVKQGEVLGIIGRNGAGKSTLLKILSKVTSPTRGNIKVRGRIASLLEVGTGFHPELTGRENIFLNGAILGMTKSEIRSKFDEIVAFSGVEKYIDTPVKRYSSGMYVRLAFAVAAHLEPEILIVDEVLAVGDAEFQKKCLGKMKDVSGEGRTVLFVSHNMDAVNKLCLNSLILEKGKLVEIGRTDNIISKYLKWDNNIFEKIIHFENMKPQITGIKLDYNSLRIGQFKLNITFNSPEIIKKIHPGIVLYNAFDTPIFGSNTRFHKDEINFENIQKGTIEFIINNVPLHTGNYKVSVWLGDEFSDFDYVENALSFEYVSTNQYINKPDTLKIGCLDLDCNWNIKLVNK
jgi:lipopolysaccharide transport system ATP-binding protein